MLAEQIVVILGAGASKPYGFPIDSELQDRIIQDFKYDFQSLPYTNISPKSLKFERGKREGLASDYITRLSDSKGIASIDNFINVNDKYELIGKISIQYYLLEYERQYLSNRSYSGINNWFELVLKELLKDCIEYKDPQALYVDNITFITFNYDRLIEYIFKKNFVSLFKDSLNEKKNTDLIDFFNYRVMHLYGSVGYLPNKAFPDNSNKVEFGEKIDTYEKIESTVNNLRLIKDGIGDISRLTNILASAKKIYFLGNGFIKKNMDVLDLNNNLNFNDPPQIYGTYFQREAEDISKLKKKYFNFNFSIPEPQIESVDCKELIRKYFVTL